MAFTWSPGRGMVHAVEQLKGFSGVADRWLYRLYPSGAEAQCGRVCSLNMQIVGLTADEPLKRHCSTGRMAHNRRLDQIAKLYGIEKHLREKELDSDESLNYRQQYSEPIVNEFFQVASTTTTNRFSTEQSTGEGVGLCA